MKFIDTIITLLKILIKSRVTNFQTLKPSNKKNVLIVGNGPSAKTSLQRIAVSPSKINTSIFAVNKFAVSEHFKDLKPDYYALLDGDFFHFNEEVFEDASKHPRVNIKPEFLEWQIQINNTWKNLLSADWPITLFVPNQYKSAYILNRCKNTPLRIIYFNYTVSKGFVWFKHWVFRTNLGMPQSQNVINAAIYLALTKLGNRINLIGLDHDFHKNLSLNDQNQLIETVSHFYTGTPFSHPLIHANTGKPVTLAETFENLHKLHKGYLELRNYAQFLHKEVYNLTPGGFVDAFEREKLEDVFPF